MHILEISHLAKSFGDVQAVSDVSFAVEPGEIFGLLGPNGAGKTTTIRIMMDIFKPDHGSVAVFGGPLDMAKKRRIGYLPEERGLYKDQKLEPTLVYLATLKGLDEKVARSRLGGWLERFDLAEHRHKKVKELSKGMQQKVQFILTILHEPELVILDEPFSGFDPVNTELIKGEIRRLKERGSTIIFSTHRMESVEEICDYVGMINKSKRVLEGSVQDVRNSYSKNAYEAEFVGSAEGLSFQPTMVKNLHGSGRVVAEFQLANESDRSALINDLNQHTQLFNFYEKLPSMHEIFIQKVEEGKHEQD